MQAAYLFACSKCKEMYGNIEKSFAYNSPNRIQFAILSSQKRQNTITEVSLHLLLALT